ncbi:hypothetical protein [Desulfuromonas sp. CSMB_57]|uniref:hypothetical protein n=1 Tax=Desulfuromonas sp. CSMB_57 TaxID=2807629 RepID=UPI001CD26BEC|nr:hypothetical protein [Desulfuromonas sp. CSMB_57]
MTAPGPDSVALMAASVAAYAELEESLQEVARAMETDRPEDLIQAQERWLALQDRTRDLDARLAGCWQQDQELLRRRPEFSRRLELMAAIVRQCRELEEQARTRKALIGEELQRLQQGLTALGGYKTSQEEKVSRIVGSW